MNSITGADGRLEIQSLDYEILILDLCSSKLDKSELRRERFLFLATIIAFSWCGRGWLYKYIYICIYIHTHMCIRLLCCKHSCWILQYLVPALHSTHTHTLSTPRNKKLPLTNPDPDPDTDTDTDTHLPSCSRTPTPTHNFQQQSQQGTFT